MGKGKQTMENAILVSYVEGEILPRYERCDPGHRASHIHHVLERARRFAGQVPGVDPDVLYAAVCFHDLGCAIDRETHEKISAGMLRSDKRIAEILTPEQIELAAQVVEDHRGSSKHAPRSIYGKILSSADRSTDLNDALRRAWQYRVKEIAAGQLDWAVKDAYEHICRKYGKDGYARKAMYFDDPEYTAMLDLAARITKDIESFRAAFIAAGTNDEKEE